MVGEVWCRSHSARAGSVNDGFGGIRRLRFRLVLLRYMRSVDQLFPGLHRLFVETLRRRPTGDKEMRYCLILAVLAPLTLPSVQASDVRAQAKEHAKDKAVQPQQVLRLTLDGPSEPLVLDRALSG